MLSFFFFFQAEDGIRDTSVTGVQTCALPISLSCDARIPRETRGRFEDPRGIRASHDSARMAPRGQRSVRFPNTDDRMEWRRMEKELRARRVAPNANSDGRDNLLVNRL